MPVVFVTLSLVVMMKWCMLSDKKQFIFKNFNDRILTAIVVFNFCQKKVCVCVCILWSIFEQFHKTQVRVLMILTLSFSCKIISFFLNFQCSSNDQSDSRLLCSFIYVDCNSVRVVLRFLKSFLIFGIR